jgi:hypothetical protein
MGLRGFCGARGHGQRRRLEARQHLCGLDPADTRRREHSLHLRFTQERDRRGGGRQIDAVPQPWRIGGRAQREPLGIQPVQLIPEPMSPATEGFEQRFFRSTALSSP